jgi:hypothetical protein
MAAGIFLRSHVLAPVLLFLSLAGLAGCRSGGLAESPAPPRVRFTRITAAAGIRFRHEDGSSGRLYFPELMGAGCALADFTGDGRPDIYLVNGARLPGAAPGPPFRAAFYRNNGDGTFTDVTAAAGLANERYGIGCCAGDYDNDGRLDLYVTNVGRNRLYHNNGDGTFTDVAASAGVGAGGFSSSAAFGDYDNDGNLDLFVCRYVVWTPETDRRCHVRDGDRLVRSQCLPIVYPAARSILYHNNGDGTFTDVTAAAGIAAVPPGRALGVVWTDFDADGNQDLYVTNDMSDNFLFVNQGNGRFKEEGRRRGVAAAADGRPQASMGAAVVDFDGDGRLDLACTNFVHEYLALYRNLGNGTFEDVSARSGLLQVTAPYVGFGLGFPDLDLDGWPDLFVVNGHVSAAEGPRMREALSEPALCLLNDRRGGFVPVAQPGPDVTAPRVRRGAAFADVDGDGDVDVLVSNWRDEPDLLRNDYRPGKDVRHWMAFRLEGVHCNRSAIGARVELRSGDRTQVQEVRSGGSYASQSDLALHFGLGEARAAAEVRVRWPGGAVETWQNLSADRVHTLRQGESAAQGSAAVGGGRKPAGQRVAPS